MGPAGIRLESIVGQLASGAASRRLIRHSLRSSIRAAGRDARGSPAAFESVRILDTKTLRCQDLVAGDAAPDRLSAAKASLAHSKNDCAAVAGRPGFSNSRSITAGTRDWTTTNRPLFEWVTERLGAARGTVCGDGRYTTE